MSSGELMPFQHHLTGAALVTVDTSNAAAIEEMKSWMLRQKGGRKLHKRDNLTKHHRWRL